MPDKLFPTDWSWLVVLVHAALAGFGGALGYVMRSLDKGGKISFWRSMVEGAAAGFVGVLVMLVCNAMELSAQWTGVIVGICGWLGAASTIRMLEKVVAKRLGIEPNTPEEVTYVPDRSDQPTDYERHQKQDPPVD